MRGKVLIAVLTVFISLSLAAGLARALDVTEAESLWVKAQSADVFQGMSMFYGIEQDSLPGAFQFSIYGPEGYSGPVYSDPNSFDLSVFYSQPILYQFKTTSGTMRYMDDAYIWDSGIPGGMSGYSGSPFTLAFYEIESTDPDMITRWRSREVIDYKAGEVSFTEPQHGSLYFQTSIFDVSGDTYYIRSDSSQKVVPEPASMLLMALGLAGFKVFKRKS